MREQLEALSRAHRWCTEYGASVSWDEAETRCHVRVRSPDGSAVVKGVGAGMYEAYVECRVRYDAAGPDGPPSWF